MTTSDLDPDALEKACRDFYEKSGAGPLTDAAWKRIWDNYTNPRKTRLNGTRYTLDQAVLKATGLLTAREPGVTGKGEWE